MFYKYNKTTLGTTNVCPNFFFSSQAITGVNKKLWENKLEDDLFVPAYNMESIQFFCCCFFVNTPVALVLDVYVPFEIKLMS